MEEVRLGTFHIIIWWEFTRMEVRESKRTKEGSIIYPEWSKIQEGVVGKYRYEQTWTLIVRSISGHAV
jgi:hypothetical protein